MKEIIEFFKKRGIKLYLIGAWAIMHHGIDLNRETRDIDLMMEKYLTIQERDSITNELRKLGYTVQWRSWGLIIKSGNLSIDLNYPIIILDEEFRRRSRKLNDLYLPSLEDLIIMKLLARRKDVKDVYRILNTSYEKLDIEYLSKRAEQAGISKKLSRVLRVKQTGKRKYVHHEE